MKKLTYAQLRTIKHGPSYFVKPYDYELHKPIIHDMPYIPMHTKHAYK